MKQVLEPVTISALLPSHSGCGIFLHTARKTFLIQVDPYLGQLIEWYRDGVSHPRPLTHDLFASLLQGIGGEIQRLVIHEARDEVYFAQLRIRCADDLGRQLLLDLDCRPSDGLALACLRGVPVFATQSLLDQVEDMTELLEQLNEAQVESFFASESSDDEDDDEDEDDVDDEDEGSSFSVDDDEESEEEEENEDEDDEDEENPPGGSSR